MTKFEYYTWCEDLTRQTLDVSLNKFGEDGWKLVTVVKREIYYYYYFIRESNQDREYITKRAKIIETSIRKGGPSMKNAQGDQPSMSPGGIINHD